MNSSFPVSTPQSSTRHYNFLSIGERGVGKTVFFVGQYGHSTQSISSENSSLRFDCNDAETQETIQKIQEYVARTAKYPPATMKMTNFDFLVREKTNLDAPPLCEVCWWDTPGESCQIYNPAFLNMMLSVDGSCLFLDAQQLVRYAYNTEKLQEQLQPVRTFVDLLTHNSFYYPIALILTKCDLINNENDEKALQDSLKDLREYWDELKVNYRLFYSKIPVVKQDGRPVLQARGKENALTWLVEAAQANPNEKPQLGSADTPINDTVDTDTPINDTADADTPINDIADKPKRKEQGAFSNRRIAILASFLVAISLLSLGGILIVERAVNSEQGNPTEQSQ
ncbi:MAG: hypothetical protein AB4058_15600 [Microcystaceae cyanobacterium]